MTRARAAAAALLVLVGAGWAVPAHAAPPSTTTLVLSSPSSAYGQTVTATAQVVASGPANGKVYFAVDGTSYMTSINSTGSASYTLPRDAAAGVHPVTATFVPRYPDQQEGSESAPASWVVTKAPTFVQVRVTGRGAHVPTSVVIGAVGDFGTVPSGPVTVTVRHVGTGKVTRRARTLDQSGAATARLGVLPTGSYRLRVTYAGDAHHLPARRSENFTVRQH